LHTDNTNSDIFLLSRFMSISKPSPVVTKNDGRTVGQGFKSLGFVLFTLVTVGSIEARLAYLQVIEGSHLHAKAESNRIRMLPKQPERGNIFDRNGKVLASSIDICQWFSFP
jgi:penicillin-binding protein 2